MTGRDSHDDWRELPHQERPIPIEYGAHRFGLLQDVRVVWEIKFNNPHDNRFRGFPPLPLGVKLI